MTEQAIPTVHYTTFWQRLLATVVDGVFWGLVIAVMNAVLQRDQEQITFTGTAIDSVWWLIYPIWCHGYAGQTLGKKLLGIRVVPVAGGRMTFGRATLREALMVTSTVLVLLSFATHPQAYVDYNAAVAALDAFDPAQNSDDHEAYAKQTEAFEHFFVTLGSLPIMAISLLSILAMFVNLIVMVSNPKRRALHDYIAGTEVHRVQ